MAALAVYVAENEKFLTILKIDICLKKQGHHILSMLQFSWKLRFKTLNLRNKMRAIKQKEDFKALLHLCNNVFCFNSIEFPPSWLAFSAFCFIFSFSLLSHGLSLWYGWGSTIVYYHKLFSFYACKTSSFSLVSLSFDVNNWIVHTKKISLLTWPLLSRYTLEI